MGIPMFEMQIDKDAKQVIPSQEQDIINALTASGNTFTDVVVMSHGWENDMDEARGLYKRFFGSLEQVFPFAVGKTLADQCLARHNRGRSGFGRGEAAAFN